MLTGWFAPFVVDYYQFTRMPRHDMPSMKFTSEEHWECVVEGTAEWGLRAQTEARRAAGEPFQPVQQSLRDRVTRATTTVRARRTRCR